MDVVSMNIHTIRGAFTFADVLKNQGKRINLYLSTIFLSEEGKAIPVTGR
jgi:hypothetical protein